VSAANEFPNADITQSVMGDQDLSKTEGGVILHLNVEDTRSQPQPETVTNNTEAEEDDDVWWERYLNKGDISNLLTLTTMLLGALLMILSPGEFADYVFAFGLFGFAGGITNWLAVKMLFDEVPGLIGSGVIPKRFEEIRRAVKNTIMRTFFDRGFIARYVTEQSGELITKLGLKEKIANFLTSDKGDAMLRTKLGNLRNSEVGLMLAMVNIDIGGAMMVNKVRDEMIAAAGEVGPLIASLLDPNELPIDTLRDEVDKLMTAKLGELDADKVKLLMEEVIRKHLGWLVVWGNVFGGCIGVIAHACGY